MSPTIFKLSVKPRDLLKETPAVIRRAGNIPAIMYGRGATPTTITINQREFEMLAQTVSSSQLIELVLGSAMPVRTLVTEVQRDPVSNRIIHVDFHRVSETEVMHAKVPLRFEGIAPAVKELGGTLVRVMNEIKVECLPQNLPEVIVVDVSALRTFGDAVAVSDLNVPKGVKVLETPEAMVVKAAEVKVETVVEATPVTATPEPEIVGKKEKKEEEATASEAAV